ncbi:Hypothetical predicted protein [Podarcis lilfordi]|uniref:Uncharacterized protein n=1 Tax=Podarcis lilfordi TaxID=74358 RepID=A0AA35P1L5_9SAUR|nr:Hypothetical predicted protein [Podarcis lilfordi]
MVPHSLVILAIKVNLFGIEEPKLQTAMVQAQHVFTILVEGQGKNNASQQLHNNCATYPFTETKRRTLFPVLKQSRFHTFFHQLLPLNPSTLQLHQVNIDLGFMGTAQVCEADVAEITPLISHLAISSSSQGTRCDFAMPKLFKVTVADFQWYNTFQDSFLPCSLNICGVVQRYSQGIAGDDN